MHAHRRKRLFLFLLIAILIPAAVLIALTARVLRQESELAGTRAAEERRAAVEQVRRELAARLEAVRLQEINRRIRTPAASGAAAEERSSDPVVVLVTPIDGDRMILPWESAQKADTLTPAFAALRQKGERLEFRSQDFRAAGETYRQMLAAAATDREKCEGRLLLGRVLVKAASLQEAGHVYHAMMQSCADIADEHGMPFRLYAAERLITAINDSETAKFQVARAATRGRWMPPQEVYLIRSLLKGNLQAVIDSRLAESEQLQALASEFARIKPQAEQSWVSFGSDPWLVSVSPAAAPLPALAFVVSSRHFAPPSASLVTKETPQSDPLGPGFVGLRIEWAAGRFDPGRTVPAASLYLAGMALILGMTTLGSYLLLRDMNRDLRMAELRTHFVASVSHELKTPLTAIRMFAETLVMGRTAEPRAQTEYLQTIMNESERLTRLVDNVLDFSKLEQGKKIYQMRTTTLQDIVRSAARAIEYPLAQQGFTLHVSVDENVPPTAADADAIQQAILNLLSNAMKYSGSSREIELSLALGGGDAVIAVTDHGVGIEPEEHGRIFEKFYRVRSPETDFVGGTGLGLTLVKHIIEAHRGRVEVRSEPGRGSTFTIRIPTGNPESVA